MKIIRRTTRLIVQTERKLTVRHLPEGKTEFVRCDQCGEEMTSDSLVAKNYDISARTIYRLIEAGKIHFAEIENDQVYVCTASIGQILDPVEQVFPKLLDGNQ